MHFPLPTIFRFVHFNCFLASSAFPTREEDGIAGLVLADVDGIMVVLTAWDVDGVIDLFVPVDVHGSACIWTELNAHWVPDEEFAVEALGILTALIVGWVSGVLDVVLKGPWIACVWTAFDADSVSGLGTVLEVELITLNDGKPSKEYLPKKTHWVINFTPL